jgi:hypothetical protein
VPTLEERLATLELRMTNLETLINSGPGTPWSKSVRGRLHAAEQVDRAAANLARAAREMRRSQHRSWSTRRQRVLVACAIVSVVTPWALLVVAHFYH